MRAKYDLDIICSLQRWLKKFHVFKPTTYPLHFTSFHFQSGLCNVAGRHPQRRLRRCRRLESKVGLDVDVRGLRSTDPLCSAGRRQLEL
jgi:hypothetical protein